MVKTFWVENFEDGFHCESREEDEVFTYFALADPVYDTVGEAIRHGEEMGYVYAGFKNREKRLLLERLERLQYDRRKAAELYRSGAVSKEDYYEAMLGYEKAELSIQTAPLWEKQFEAKAWKEHARAVFVTPWERKVPACSGSISTMDAEEQKDLIEEARSLILFAKKRLAEIDHNHFCGLLETDAEILFGVPTRWDYGEMHKHDEHFSWAGFERMLKNCFLVDIDFGF